MLKSCSASISALSTTSVVNEWNWSLRCARQVTTRSEGTGPDEVFGIVLEPGIDPNGGYATVSVARSGVYDATQLVVDDSVELKDFADRLRERGIFLEKLELVGIIPVPEMATVEPTINPTEQLLNPS